MSESIHARDAELHDLLNRAHVLARETSPITPAMVAAIPTWRAAYSDRTCALMATLCEIAYDRFEDTTGVGREAMEIRLLRGGFRLISTYDVNACTQAYLAVSDQMAVLAFRGTESAADWRINLNAARVPIHTRVGAVKVHSGFLSAFQSVEQQLRADIAAHVPPGLGLYITGHSLGGGVAQIASAMFDQDNVAACYTFGSPRVGGADFDAEVKCPHYRLVNAWDLVPGVPPPFYNGYRHGGDVRTLGELGKRPLRRNRPIVEGFLKSVLALILYPLSRKLFIVDDHMIDRYEAKLIAVAQTRAPAKAEKVEPPMEAAEIAARLQLTFTQTARRKTRRLSPDNIQGLSQRAREIADRIVLEEPTAEGRENRTSEGEAAFTRLVSEMATIAEGLADYPDDQLGEQTLAEALLRLCPLPPIC